MNEGLTKYSSHGANQSGVRLYNERLLLTILQRRGALPGSDLARVAGLSPQTVSVILRKLENDGILERGAPTRGKVGKPSVPMKLSAGGVLSFGLKIGRRSADLVLMDILGQIRSQRTLTYCYPVPDQVRAFLSDGLEDALGALAPQERARVCGLGIAAPFDLWRWTDQVGAPDRDFQAWKQTDIVAMAREVTDLPVSHLNDATAACHAEHVFGMGKKFCDYAYFYIGAFIGGGVVLNHSLYEGGHKNAGAFGPMRMRGDNGEIRQLMDTASLYLLENALMDAGLPREALWTQPQDWSGFDDIAGRWIDATARELAQASLSTCAVIDFQAIVIDGAFPAAAKARLVSQTRAEMDRLDKRGLIPPQVIAGVVGINARAIGAACHPMFERFLLNTNAHFAA